MELLAGQIVFSRAGRDRTDVYMVVAQDGDRVLLANGVKRTLAAPKPKNVRHIIPTGSFVNAEDQKTDQSLKAALRAYEQSLEAGPQGG